MEFFVSRCESQVSGSRHQHYHLYRVFTFRRNPRLYVLDGDLSRVCELSPIQFMARVS